jgi:hypothetical protein
MDELNNHLRRESGEEVDDRDGDEPGEDIGDVIPIDRLYDENEG